ncbi:RusA family crossover junction endodeoxyribonuclease [Leifsonia sp. Root227]|uniref:RusA family crossover junction endodeoxyribonuclease n=1 Tax=Leifsonia sp. Root227 TaxID=1736496 RepID=UPI0009ECAAEF|nr:RusA family crossover junction endodeoxyribonuclease [Leifsonia sp. Root227]
MNDLETLYFTVEGTPVPQGSHAVSRFGRIYESNKKLAPWRKTVTAAAVDALSGREGFDEAVYVLLDFWLPRPKTVKRVHPTTRPDVDKLSRAVLDALTAARVWTDDSLVLSLHAVKKYADEGAGVDVKVRRLA